MADHHARLLAAHERMNAANKKVHMAREALNAALAERDLANQAFNTEFQVSWNYSLVHDAEGRHVIGSVNKSDTLNIGTI